MVWGLSGYADPMVADARRTGIVRQGNPRKRPNGQQGAKLVVLSDDVTGGRFCDSIGASFSQGWADAVLEHGGWRRGKPRFRTAGWDRQWSRLTSCFTRTSFCRMRRGARMGHVVTWGQNDPGGHMRCKTR